MLNVKWQERTTTTEILEVSWFMSIKTIFTDDMCRDVMTEEYPSMFDMVSFMAITISRGGIRNTLKGCTKA